MLAMGLASDMIAEAKHWPVNVTGDGGELQNGDRKVRIISDAAFVSDNGRWQSQLVPVQPASGRSSFLLIFGSRQPDAGKEGGSYCAIRPQSQPTGGHRPVPRRLPGSDRRTGKGAGSQHKDLAAGQQNSGTEFDGPRGPAIASSGSTASRQRFASASRSLRAGGFIPAP